MLDTLIGMLTTAIITIAENALELLVGLFIAWLTIKVTPILTNLKDQIEKDIEEADTAIKANLAELKLATIIRAKSLLYTTVVALEENKGKYIRQAMDKVREAAADGKIDMEELRKELLALGAEARDTVLAELGEAGVQELQGAVGDVNKFIMDTIDEILSGLKGRISVGGTQIGRKLETLSNPL